MVQNEDLDYFDPRLFECNLELMSFKLYCSTKRVPAYHMPMEMQSNFANNI